ncbi:MAG: nucleotidyl transferase AbiEii/AbiGii toxin family protein [Candidatus Aminicenantaceae bacterium]
MRRKNLHDISTSVHERLLNKARASGRPFNELFQYFSMERFLYRLSKTAYVQKFVLKGALMFTAWNIQATRTTKDIDLLGRLENSVEAITTVMRGICNETVKPDGMNFDPNSVTCHPIIEDAVYEGLRVRVRGNLGKSRVVLQLDVGFGDVVFPSELDVKYPAILDFPAPELKGYSRESMIAEKFQTMIKLDELNSRMKDFYDIWLLSKQFDFIGPVLAESITKTFKTRKTKLPDRPTVFKKSFAEDQTRETQWRAFLRKTNLAHTPHLFYEVITEIKLFLGPVSSAIFAQKSFQKKWKAPGLWK